MILSWRVTLTIHLIQAMKVMKTTLFLGLILTWPLSDLKAQLDYKRAEQLLAWFQERGNGWELSLGTALMHQNQRPVYTPTQVPTGAPSGLTDPRRVLNMRTHYLFDFDFKHGLQLLPKWSFIYGLGAGIMQYEVFWQDFRYNTWYGAYFPFTDPSKEMQYNYTTRILLGVKFNQALSNKHNLTLMAYSGYQLNGWEKDYRVEDDNIWGLPDLNFGVPSLFGRRFIGFEMGINTKLPNIKALQTSLDIRYRYVHFNSGRDHLPTHVLPGIHQIVFGWNFRANPSD